MLLRSHRLYNISVCMWGECFYQIMGLSFRWECCNGILNALSILQDTRYGPSPTPNVNLSPKIRWNNDKCQETIDHISVKLKYSGTECGHRYNICYCCLCKPNQNTISLWYQTWISNLSFTFILTVEFML